MICSGWQEDLLVYHLALGRRTRTYSFSSSGKYVQWSLFRSRRVLLTSLTDSREVAARRTTLLEAIPHYRDGIATQRAFE